MPGGALVGATLGDRWGVIHQPYGLDLDRSAFLVPFTQTPQGFTFFSNEVAWFYLQSTRAPAEMFGLLSATSRSIGLPGQPRDLVYTMSMDAYVPSPIPEPGTLVLVTTCLAGGSSVVDPRSRRARLPNHIRACFYAIVPYVFARAFEEMVNGRP